MSDVSVIILNFNGFGLTKGCVESIKEKVREIIVVDNGSTDDSVERLKELNVKLVALPENKFFAGGMNEGARHAKGDYLLFLNNDTLVCDDSVEVMAETFKLSEEVGLVSPAIYFGDRKRLWSAGMVRGPMGYGFKMRGYGEKAWFDEGFVGFASGCALMVKAELFRQVGGFSEEYELYYEDVDLCEKLRCFKHKVFFQPKASIIHLTDGHLGKTSEKMRGFALRKASKNLLRFHSVWDGLSPTILLMDALFVLKTMASLDFTRIKAVLLGKIDFWCDFEGL